MKPAELALKSQQLATALQTMSPNPAEAVCVLLGALGIVTGATEGTDAASSWGEVTNNVSRETFHAHFVATKAKRGIPG